jgi:lipoyl(octanoyl) transferase
MGRELRVCDLRVTAYRDALALQESLLEARTARRIPDVLLLVEHNAVYTLGRNASDDNMLVSEADLAKRGIELIRTGRGGQITYHGPGQLVVYPILHLGDAGLGAQEYISRLEQTIIMTLGKLGIAACTDREHRGVWIAGEKIAAVGVRITRQVTMHGFSLNVNPNLSHYDSIVPCGIRNRGVTSMAKLGYTFPMSSVAELVTRSFTEVMGYDTVADVTRDRLFA